jgi:predicted DNA-binding transcriptional regulator YafY
MVSNKSRLLRLYRYLYVNTDEKHFTTKAEIMDALRDEETIYSRQTVRDDIDTLSKEGYDIETVVSSGNFYYFRDREFSLEELRLIGDAVASSRFISKKQKNTILKKLKRFCSKFQAESVERHLVSVEPQTSGDARVYEMVNTINDAINQGKKISFQYSDADAVKTGRRRKNTDERVLTVCSPFDLAWDGRSFYLAAWSDAEEKPVLYEVSRVIMPVILEASAVPVPKNFKTESFVQEMLS